MRHLGFALLLAPALSAAGDLTQVGTEFVVPSDQSFSQSQSRLAGYGELNDLVYAWTGQGWVDDVFLRTFDGEGVAEMDDMNVNDSQNQGKQNESDVAIDEDGYIFVAWTDWLPHDGGGSQGIGGRIIDPTGTPVGPEFKVNQVSAQSQWEPKVAAIPGGGWVTAFNGENDGDVFFRLWTQTGGVVSGDIQANTFDNNAQIDVDIAVNRQGTMMLVWQDQGANGTGSGSTIFGRVFTDAGVPVQTPEVQLHTTAINGDQREPRIATDGFGNFVVVWEDRANDPGGGHSSWVRRFDKNGTPLGPEWQANTTTALDQRRPHVGADFVGNFVVIWEDTSLAPVRNLVAQCFDVNENPIGGEQVIATGINSDAGNDGAQPNVLVDWAGESYAFSYTKWTNAAVKTDIYSTRYEHDAISAASPPMIGTTFELDLELPGGEGLGYVLMASTGDGPAIPLPGSPRVLHLLADDVFTASLVYPESGFFSGFQGVLGPGGTATASVTVPNQGILVGLDLYFAAVTLIFAEPDIGKALRHATRTLKVTIQ